MSTTLTPNMGLIKPVRGTGEPADIATSINPNADTVDAHDHTSGKGLPIGVGAISAGAITDVEVATANKDGLTTKPSLRTIGTGAQQAAAGNHTHTQAQSHNSPDTDSATSSLHHTVGTGANQAAAGNHTHASDGASSGGGTTTLADLAAGINEYLYWCNGAGATVTLPSAANNVGKRVTVKCISGGSCTLNPAGGQELWVSDSNVGTLSIPNGDSYTLMAYAATGWMVI